mgnify:CR=1 FL=1
MPVARFTADPATWRQLNPVHAVAALRGKLDLVEVYRRPEADYWARLWWAAPAAERLLVEKIKDLLQESR